MGHRVKKAFPCYLPEGLLNRLNKYCEELGLDRNTVIHCAIEDMLDAEDELAKNFENIVLIKEPTTLEDIVDEVYEGKSKFNDKRLQIKTPTEEEKLTTDKAAWVAEKLQMIKDQLKKDKRKK